MEKRRYSATPQHYLYLHEMFPCGRPQKQGKRVAGPLRTKGEH